MRVLITGGGGFIGSHLVERLLLDGHDVRVLDNFATGRRENLVDFGDHIEIVEGDVQSYERAHTAVRDCELVFHQAALPSVPRSVQDPLTSNAVNVIGTLNILLAARDSGVRRVVYASSSSVYGANPTLPKNETLNTQPISPYAVAKLAGEGYCRSFTEVYGLETVALRYFNVFGRRQDPDGVYAAVIPRWISAMLDGKQIVMYGDGTSSRDFCYVDNIVQANLLAATSTDPGVLGTVYNCGCNERTDLRQLFAMIRDSLAKDYPHVMNAEPTYEPIRKGDIPHSQAAIDKITAALGYMPTHKVADGMAETVSWFAQRLKRK